MHLFYTALSIFRKVGFLLIILAGLGVSTGHAWAGAVEDFSATIKGFSDKPRPFPEKFVVFDFNDRQSSLVFGKGQPWRLINFWAVWCMPCILELPSIKGLQDKVKQAERFKILFISADMPATGAALKYLIKQKNLPEIESFYVKDFYMWQSFDMTGLPTTLLVNPEGQIVYTFTGGADWQSPKALAFFKAVLPPGVFP